MSLLDRFRLDGRVAVITGAGKGIGAGTARAFAEAGADVVLAARTGADLESVAEDIRSMGRRALCCPTDVMDAAQVEALAAQAVAEMGRIDIVVNNAGGFPPKAALETSADEFESAFRFNVATAFRLTTLCAEQLAEHGGSVVNISSVAGQAPSPCFAAYGTAKAALTFLTRQMAQEFAPKIRVNAIAVGATKTDALETVLSDDIEKVMVELTPMGRLGEVEDVALGALYLASPAAAYVTGEILAVNGGLERTNLPMPRAFGGVG